jgi:hypothetical protein
MWTARINTVIKAMFPIEAKWCMWQKQEAMRARIARSDKIKREMSGKGEAEQQRIMEMWEMRAGLTINQN